jgi:acetamidase/formamidase
LEPALVVNSGDSIDVETYTGFYIYDKAPPEFLTAELLEICQHLPTERQVGPGPHLLTGPIYVNGAEPGDVLEVKLQDISPRLPMGFNAIRPGWGALPEQFTEPRLRFIPLDLDKGVAQFPNGSGISIPLEPFFGILGVATDETNRSSVPPEFMEAILIIENCELVQASFCPYLSLAHYFLLGMDMQLKVMAKLM